MNAAQRMPRAYVHGQSMVEFIVILPTLLLLTLGIIQFAQIYIAKNTLDLAAFEGVRAGTLHNASAKWIDCGIAQGLMPLYGSSDTLNTVKTGWLEAECQVGVGPTRYLAAYSNAFADVKPPPGLLGGNGKSVIDLQILNPTAATFQDFGEIGLSSKEEIPNDRLMWRSTDVKPASGENIQDANLLMIRVQYCYPMDVLFIRQIVQGLAIGANKLINNQTTFGTACYTSGGVPLVAQTTMLMQSPARQSLL